MHIISILEENKLANSAQNLNFRIQNVTIVYLVPDESV